MKAPIFIIGCPRSGTTMLLDILSSHEDFAWISSHFNFFPKILFLNIFNSIYDVPLFGKNLFLVKKNLKYILPEPVEPWRFWNTYLTNFKWERGGKIIPSKRTEKDITQDEILELQKCILLICKFKNKNRFLSKYTDFPRIRYLLQVFPDAKFIHLIRDPRATVFSYFNKIRNGEFNTWNEREWWIRGWPKKWRDSWREKYNSCLSFVAFQYKFFIKNIWEDAKNIQNSQYLEIRYEDFIKHPQKNINFLLKFCNLGKSLKLEWYLKHIQLFNMNFKWKKNLSIEERNILLKIISENEFLKLFEN
jgi:hypothetical protein